jgi:hypothetical protein
MSSEKALKNFDERISRLEKIIIPLNPVSVPIESTKEDKDEEFTDENGKEKQVVDVIADFEKLLSDQEWKIADLREEKVDLRNARDKLQSQLAEAKKEAEDWEHREDCMEEEYLRWRERAEKAEEVIRVLRESHTLNEMNFARLNYLNVHERAAIARKIINELIDDLKKSKNADL